MLGQPPAWSTPVAAKSLLSFPSGVRAWTRFPIRLQGEEGTRVPDCLGCPAALPCLPNEVTTSPSLPGLATCSVDLGDRHSRAQTPACPGASITLAPSRTPAVCTSAGRARGSVPSSCSHIPRAASENQPGVLLPGREAVPGPQSSPLRSFMASYTHWSCANVVPLS